MLDLNHYNVLTFDCYGTLIDWEGGILPVLQSILTAHQIQLDAEATLQFFAEFESALEAGEYRPYREVLRGVVQRFGEQFKFTPSSTELNALADSIQYWQPFSDTVETLKRLKQRFKLAVLSNIDEDLFAFSAQHLQIPFDWVITAEQVKSYKPALDNFQAAIARVGVPVNQILHVAASLYHDIVPANSLGLATVWVNRRRGQRGFGAVLPATGQPDLEVPDLQTLAEKVNL